MACESAKEKLDDGEHGHGGRAFDEPLEVLGQSSVAAKPGEAALDDPTSRQEVKALGADRAPDDLEAQSLPGRRAGGDIALIARVGEQELEPGKPSSDASTGQAQAVTILDVGGMNDQPQRQAQRVGDEMALAAVHLLAGVPRV